MKNVKRIKTKSLNPLSSSSAKEKIYLIDPSEMDVTLQTPTEVVSGKSL